MVISSLWVGKKRLCSLFVFIFLTIAPTMSHAVTCDVTLADDVGVTNLGITASGVAASGELTAKIKKTQLQITKRLNTMRKDVVRALGGVSQAVTSMGVQVSKSNSKSKDVLATKIKNQELRKREAQAAIDSKPNTQDCRTATGRQHVLQGQILKRATEEGLLSNYMQKYNQSGNSIRYQAELFYSLMANFCDPNTNGGLMPTEENPIQTTSGPLWCGMNQDIPELANMHIKIPTMLFEPNKLIDHPKAREAALISMSLMLGLPLDQINKADFNTQSGQAEFVKFVVEKSAKMSIPAAVVARRIASIFPAHGNAGSDWARAILLNGLPPEVLEQRQSELDGNVSQSQFEEAMVSQFTDVQYMMDLQRMSRGGYERQILNLSSMLAYIQMERLKEMEISNTLSAVTFAEGLGG